MTLTIVETTKGQATGAGRGASRGADRFPILVVVLSLVVAAIFTWPLAPHFGSSIPYSLQPVPGLEAVPLMPGDHLSSYYWFWLFSDNLLGDSALFTNPYEFNSASGLQSAVYANFPLSVLFTLLLPLGPAAAYNALIILSFACSALAMHLLARSWGADRWGSLVAALVFSAVPYRVSHVAGGQVFGYAIFFLPLILFLVERIIATGRWRYGWCAGLCLFVLAPLEYHTMYLIALTLGLYIPGRLLLFREAAPDDAPSAPRPWPGILGGLAGGVSFGVFCWTSFGVKAGLPLVHPSAVWPLFLGTLSVLLGWLLVSALLSSLTDLPFAHSRDRAGRLCWLLSPLLLTSLRALVPVPHLGLILGSACGLLLAAGFVRLLVRHRPSLRGLNLPAVRVIAIALGSCMAVASAYLLHVRSTVLLSSVAGKGRSIGEVLLFSPEGRNLLSWGDINREHYVFIGLTLLALAIAGSLPLLRRAPAAPGRTALAACLAFLALVLTTGPRLTLFPLYRLLYDHLPFFNYPRVPGRFVMVGLTFLCLLAALAVTSLRHRLAASGRRRFSIALTGALVLLPLVEYHPGGPLGLCLFPGDSAIYEAIPASLPEGRVVLELPLWPGPSHQSSKYEYTVTRTRRPMINGYAPVVFQEYVDRVFWPLYPLDHGELGPDQARELERNRVGLVTFHDDPLVYTEKVSPFPPRLGLLRLASSSWLTPVTRDGEIHLFSFNAGAGGPFVAPAAITSPVRAIFFPAEHRGRTAGRFIPDPLSSGYFLLREGDAGNVVAAEPGADGAGPMLVGRDRFFPAGEYTARFRLRSGRGEPGREVARLSIVAEGGRPIASRVVTTDDLMPDGVWVDVPLDFAIPTATLIGHRVDYSGASPLRANMVVIGFADRPSGPGSFEAEDLLRQTGTVVDDPAASGGEAVIGRAGHHPVAYLSHGPYLTLEPGSYRARFALRRRNGDSPSPHAGLALLEVAADLGRRVFGSRIVTTGDLDGGGYRDVAIDFTVPFRCEADLRVKFLGAADLLVDRISVDPLGTTERRGVRDGEAAAAGR